MYLLTGTTLITSLGTWEASCDDIQNKPKKPVLYMNFTEICHSQKIESVM